MDYEVWFRHADRRVPFLWEGTEQPAARWHSSGSGPVQYASDTPDGAWAEFLRHEGITDAADLEGISRSLWALEVDVSRGHVAEPALPRKTVLGDLASYPECQKEAGRLRDAGATALVAPAAALLGGSAGGEIVASGKLRPAAARDGRTLCLFGTRPTLVGHRCVETGQPPEPVLDLTRRLA